MDKVWVVGSGCMYDGWAIVSVHSTPESAEAAAIAKVAEEERQRQERIQMAQEHGHSCDEPAWAKEDGDPSCSRSWCSGTYWVSVFEYDVTPCPTGTAHGSSSG